MGGLHDDRQGNVHVAQPAEHAHPVEVGHDEVEDEQVDPGLRALDPGDGLLAAFDRDRVIAGALHHLGEQPTLDRIIVGDEDGGWHQLLVREAVSNWRNLEPMRKQPVNRPQQRAPSGRKLNVR